MSDVLPEPIHEHYVLVHGRRYPPKQVLVVALADPTDVLVPADSQQEVLAWLATHERRAPYGMFRVPASLDDAEGLAPL